MSALIAAGAAVENRQSEREVVNVEPVQPKIPLATIWKDQAEALRLLVPTRGGAVQIPVFLRSGAANGNWRPLDRLLHCESTSRRQFLSESGLLAMLA